jgi:hypothetical protein
MVPSLSPFDGEKSAVQWRDAPTLRGGSQVSEGLGDIQRTLASPRQFAANALIGFRFSVRLLSHQLSLSAQSLMARLLLCLHRSTQTFGGFLGPRPRRRRSARSRGGQDTLARAGIGGLF